MARTKRRRSVARGNERRGSESRGRSATRRRSRSSAVNFEVSSSVARDIYAVGYFVLAAVTVLSLQGNFGVIGEAWVGVLRPILGWGVNVIPGIFGLIAVMLFFAKSVQFGFARITGVVTLMVALLSIFHMSVDTADLYTAASQGQYGGYTGFVMNFLFREVLKIGHIGASIVFVALLVVGVMLTFNISLSQMAELVTKTIQFKRIKVRAVHDGVEEELSAAEDDEGDPEVPELMIRRGHLALGDGGDGEVTSVQVAMDEHRPERDVVLKEIVAEGADGGGSGGMADDSAGDGDSDTDGAVDLRETVADDMPEFVWEFPSLDLLSPPAKVLAADKEFLKEHAEKIRNKLKQFGIEVQMHEVNVGPTVIQYTLRPHEGVKLSKITALKNDIALALAAKAIRIEAPIPGKSLVGIELPNDKRTNVHLREILESKEFSEIDSNLRLVLGRDVAGKPIVGDLTNMPHLLIAGATGSGKSVGVNTFLISLIYQNSPEDLKLILVDPKRVELAVYNNIPHLLTPVITEPDKAAIALRWAVAEMVRRYKLLSSMRKKNITEYLADPTMEEKLPKIVIVIDELADLMMTAKNEVEASICRIAQMARAVGLHLIVATQRPSVDVITGLIKANIPSRIAYAVSSSIDSRTILDGVGAEDLLGRGDMLYLPGGMSKPLRVQGVYMSSAEIERVTNFVKTIMPPQYDETITSRKVADASLVGVPESQFGTDDEMDDEAVMKEAMRIIVESRKASASLLQRRLKVGYARAARLLDMMEERGYIGPSQGAKAREIYIENVDTTD